MNCTTQTDVVGETSCYRYQCSSHKQLVGYFMYQIFRKLHNDEIKHIFPPKSCILFQSVRSVPHFLVPIMTILDNSKAIVVLARFKINTILGTDVLACFKVRTYRWCNILHENYVFFYHSKYFFIFLKRHVLFTAAATQCRMTEWKIRRTGRGQFRRA